MKNTKHTQAQIVLLEDIESLWLLPSLIPEMVAPLLSLQEREVMGVKIVIFKYLKCCLAERGWAYFL